MGEGVVKGLRRASGPFVRLMTAAKAAITFITVRRQGAAQLNPHPPLAMALSGCSLLSLQARLLVYPQGDDGCGLKLRGNGVIEPIFDL